MPAHRFLSWERFGQQPLSPFLLALRLCHALPVSAFTHRSGLDRLRQRHVPTLTPPQPFPSFPVLSPASKSTGFSLPLCIPFVSLRKLIKSSSVLHTRERREWEGTCFSLSVDPSLPVGPRQSCILAQALFPPLNSCVTWKEGFLKSFGAIKFTGYDSCVFCREIRPLTHPVSPTSGTWW